MSKAQATRMLILQKSFDLIYQKGYQATSIDDIIATTQLTKGAFFYHFKTKDEMGLSMIKEIMHPGMHQTMIRPLEHTGDPLSRIYEMINGLLMDDVFFKVEFGCPAINMIEEMSPLNETFKKALQQMVVKWQEAICEAIKTSQLNGKINTKVIPEEVALMVTSGYAGVRNMGKIFGKSCYKTYLTGFKNYLDQL